MIEHIWNALISASAFPVHRRVSQDHPLDLFAQVDESGRIGLLAISPRNPGAAQVYSAVDVAVGMRSDASWATSISLKQPLLRPMFEAMCNEIIDQGQRSAPDADAASFVLQHLSRWHRLLALGPDGLLSKEERLGLLGELSLLSMAVDLFGPDIAVDGWNGPHDAPQDFYLPCGFVEVKAIHTGAPEVKISSLEQLDVNSGTLALVVHEFSPCPAGTGGSSLSATVDEVRAKLIGSASAAAVFEASLRTAGYQDRAEYAEEEFRVARLRWYRVASDFPRLCRSEIGHAITAAKYKLLLAELDRFETNRMI